MKTLSVYKIMLLTALALALGTVTASAADAAPAAGTQRDVMQNVAGFLAWNSPFTVAVNGKKLELQGEMVNSRLLVPVRAVFEAAGAAVTWNPADRSWRAEKDGGLVAEQQVGDARVIVNGAAMELDSAAVMHGDTVFTSARVIEAALGLELRWDSANRTLKAAALPVVPGFRVWSDAFAAYADLPDAYAQAFVPGGQNINPPLHWEGAPAGTQSFAVVMYDVNPIADSFLHWSVLNIPAAASGLPQASAGHFAGTDGVELNPYYGMAPPHYSGDHLYRFAVYALDTDKLEVPEQSPTYFDQLEPLLLEHSLGYAEVDGFFEQ